MALVVLTLVGCGNPRHVVASARIDVPPPGKALVNFVYDYGTEKDQCIVNEKGEIVFLVAPHTVHQVVIDPGVHDFFIMSPLGGMVFNAPGIDSMIRIHASAGRIYDASMSVTFTNYTFAFPAHPGTKLHKETLALTKSLQSVGPLDRSIPDIIKRENKYQPLVRKIQKSFQDNPDVKPELQMKESESRAQ